MKNRLSGAITKYVDPAGARKYVTQVSLILLSLLIATSVDRCRERNKEQAKLREYLTAIQEDVVAEIKNDGMNLYDCKQDQQCLENALQLLAAKHPDSSSLAVHNFQQVLERGVFRSFPPTTFELMAQNGDAHLLKNLALRNQLAGVFAFRQDVVQQDFEAFDREINNCIAHLGPFIDFPKMYAAGIRPALIDEAGLVNTPRTELFLLSRAADVKAFHLQNALKDLREIEAALTEELKK